MKASCRGLATFWRCESWYKQLQEALARQEQEAKAAEAENLAQDLTERLRELRESRERRRQTLQV